MPDDQEPHLQALSAGDFSRAKNLYGSLIESDPENLEFQCGFFAAGWWENRAETRGRKKPGRPLATYLTQEWDAFETTAGERNCTGSLSFRATMRSILGSAAEHFRIAFQEEGPGAVESELLLQLGRCLIRIEDYRNAADVLQYARKRSTPSAAVYFLLGEALASLGGDSTDAGFSAYRDGCALDPTAIDPTLIASEPAARTFGYLMTALDQRVESVVEWFPAYFMACVFAPGLRRLGPDEVEGFRLEADRLYRDLDIVVEKYREKVRARAAFQDMVLLHHFTFHERDSGRTGEIEKRLKDNSPELFQYYKAERGKR